MSKISLTLLGIAAVVAVLGTLAACSPLAALNVLTPAGASQASTGIAYGAGERRRLDVYRPLSPAGPAPVVVFFFGGNWTSGERANYAFVARALAARGMVVVVPDYRLHPEVSYPDFLDDSAAALAWTAREVARFGGDPKRLFVMGHSAGAYNAAMLALDARWLERQGMAPSDLRGWIGLAGPYDFIPIENKTTRPVFHFPNTPAASQPINHVSASSPPALLIAANKDDLVNPQRNTGGMAAKLRAHGVSVDEVYLDKVNHITLVASFAGPLRLLAPTLDTVAGFVAAVAARPAGKARPAAAVAALGAAGGS
ncbi:alpha/beta hydrolase [Massilia glaciei]|uniref:Alpha/beta hydrolase n=1 Tax=Massilia glaciei TaxID=1524097 RepID=A0A2U2HEZ7_9BURK|nr:alpha/beta hydrolase [Massilia glaciei]PWF42469.1 alpha/beta hydrolase [Massilia glaciei]